MRLFDDLGAWEAGELPIEELERRQPEAASLVALSERVSAAGSESALPPPWGWERVEARLSEQRRVASWQTRRLRLTAACSLAALALGVLAYAAPDTARRGVASVVDGVTELFTDDTEPTPSPLPTATPDASVEPAASVAPPGSPAGVPGAGPVASPTASPEPSDGSQTPEPTATPHLGNEGEGGGDETPHPEEEGSPESTATPHPDEGGG